MALQVVSPKVAVYKVTGVKDGQEQTEEYTFARGELLPEWVSPYQQFVLTNTGMARQVGDFPDPNLKRPEDMPAPVLMPEHSPQSVIGNTEVTGPQVVTRRVTGQADDAPAGRSGGDLPAEDDNKPVWEDYAVNRLGMSRNAAESMRKADLVAEVKKRHATKKADAEADETPPPTFMAKPTKPVEVAPVKGGK